MKVDENNNYNSSIFINVFFIDENSSTFINVFFIDELKYII
jgi:hypothetical protein